MSDSKKLIEENTPLFTAEEVVRLTEIVCDAALNGQITTTTEEVLTTDGTKQILKTEVHHPPDPHIGLRLLALFCPEWREVRRLVVQAVGEDGEIPSEVADDIMQVLANLTDDDNKV